MSNATATIEAIEAAGGDVNLDIRTGEIKLRVVRSKVLPPDVRAMARNHRHHI